MPYVPILADSSPVVNIYVEFVRYTEYFNKITSSLLYLKSIFKNTLKNHESICEAHKMDIFNALKFSFVMRKTFTMNKIK